MTWQTVSRSPQETYELGCLLGSFLHAGDVVFFRGPLGAGKTRMIQGLARGLGAVGARSPSFSLVHCYRARVPLYHADLYRLAARDELEVLDLAETCADGVLAVEWPELAERDFPERLEVELVPDPDREEVRAISIRPQGGGYDELMMELRKSAHPGL